MNKVPSNLLKEKSFILLRILVHIGRAKLHENNINFFLFACMHLMMSLSAVLRNDSYVPYINNTTLDRTELLSIANLVSEITNCFQLLFVSSFTV